ncbi:MAG TPA: DUF4079 family protein [Candidatus Atribacteria bacterium]|nr:DUF4079 family protein [Candidatus Atribacteria bacterium]
MKKCIFFFWLLAFLLFPLLSIAHEDAAPQTNLQDYNWIIHAILSLASLIILVLLTLYGLSIRGIIKIIKTKNKYNIHKKLGISLLVLIIITFSYGLWLSFLHEQNLLSTLHGLTGVIILSLTLIQVALSLIIKKKK